MSGVPHYADYTPREVAAFHRAAGSNKTGFLGVKRLRDGRYEAYIRVRGEANKRYCGSAPTAESAARLYDTMARALFGPEAVTNFDTR